MQNFKFTIITATYDRPEKLIRSVESVLNQNYTNFELIIINDSPDTNYSKFENIHTNNSKIKYFKNKQNEGNNFCKNLALENVSSDSDYVIFLDDDDWFCSDALESINNTLNQNPNTNWLITNRIKGAQNLTKVKEEKGYYDYFWDMLITRKIYGDATHIIKTTEAKKYKFSSHVKNGEELYYFIQMPFDFIYKDLNSTDSEGYADNGLTELLKKKYKENTFLLWKDKLNIKMLTYLILRTLKSLSK